jgi:hypothetical protein
VSNAKERSQAVQPGIQTGSGTANSDHRQKRGGSGTRIGAAGAVHYVIGRGINGQAIFSDKKDYLNFIERLGDLPVGPKRRASHAHRYPINFICF